ncbi:MAG: hypothetical protein KBT47_09270 [Armatimonadetes bacterium]|nr:hypothetical protein [Candidatus Hippobium faecium]
MSFGSRIWCYADGYMPQKTETVDCHESLLFFNPNEEEAHIEVSLHFEDRDPVKGLKYTVGGEKMKALRLDHKEDIFGFEIPKETHYSIKVASDVPIVCQFGRMDVPDHSFYINIGYHD